MLKIDKPPRKCRSHRSFHFGRRLKADSITFRRDTVNREKSQLLKLRPLNHRRRLALRTGGWPVSPGESLGSPGGILGSGGCQVTWRQPKALIQPIFSRPTLALPDSFSETPIATLIFCQRCECRLWRLGDSLPSIQLNTAPNGAQERDRANERGPISSMAMIR
jgi:hypothetical protein